MASLTTYDVPKLDYKGLAFFSSNGGMSAELCVAKCLASLNATESSSWQPYRTGGPQHGTWGPQPVFMSEGDNFLHKSVEKTVQLYETHVPSARREKIKVAILGPGSMAIPYLCHHLLAIYLPTQFLVSFNRLADLQAQLKKATGQHLASYAVAGYDISMGNVAVAWLKFLQLPKSYRTLLESWNIQHVLFVDNHQTSGGECLFRKLYLGRQFAYDPDLQNPDKIGTSYTEEEVKPEDIFIHYVQYGTTRKTEGFNGDVSQLLDRIADITSFAPGLEPIFRRGDDWESSMTVQISRLKLGLPPLPTVRTLEATDSIHLYHLSLHLSLVKYLRNKTRVIGVAMNPYYLCNPLYEEMMGYLPFCFWQLNPVETTAENLKKQLDLAQTKLKDDPTSRVENILIKTTKNFGDWIEKGQWDSFRTKIEQELPGVKVLEHYRYLANEVEMQDGKPSGWALFIFDVFNTYQSASKLQAWMDSRQVLTIEDVVTTANHMQTIQFGRIRVINP